jgi:hypothetical protein
LFVELAQALSVCRAQSKVVEMILPEQSQPAASAGIA